MYCHLTVAYWRKSNQHLSWRREPWHLSDSAFFLPAFCSVYSTYLNSVLSKSQGNLFIWPMKATHRKKTLLHTQSKDMLLFVDCWVYRVSQLQCLAFPNYTINIYEWKFVFQDPEFWSPEGLEKKEKIQSSTTGVCASSLLCLISGFMTCSQCLHSYDQLLLFSWLG